MQMGYRLTSLNFSLSIIVPSLATLVELTGCRSALFLTQSRSELGRHLIVYSFLT